MSFPKDTKSCMQIWILPYTNIPQKISIEDVYHKYVFTYPVRGRANLPFPRESLQMVFTEWSWKQRVSAGWGTIMMMKQNTHLFYRQLNFPSEPGVANEILENEPKSCLAVA